jgi:hypothetical protein
MMSLPIQVLGRREREVISEMPAVTIPRPKWTKAAYGLSDFEQFWRETGGRCSDCSLCSVQ